MKSKRENLEFNYKSKFIFRFKKTLLPNRKGNSTTRGTKSATRVRMHKKKACSDAMLPRVKPKV